MQETREERLSSSFCRPLSLNTMDESAGISRTVTPKGMVQATCHFGSPRQNRHIARTKIPVDRAEHREFRPEWEIFGSCAYFIQRYRLFRW